MEMSETLVHETAIRKTLIELGVPTNLSGYHYLVMAIKLYLEDTTGNLSMTNNVYPKILARFGASPAAIETATRKAVQACLPNINDKQWIEVFGREKSVVLNGKSSMRSSVFIQGVTEYLKIELRRN